VWSAGAGALVAPLAQAQTAPAASAHSGSAATAPAHPAAPAAATPAHPSAAAAKPGKAAPTDDSTKHAEDRLSDEAELTRVVGLYEAGKYGECSAEIERLLDPTGKAPLRQPGVVENARVYWAACLLGAGQGDAADAPLRAAIHENPQMKPPDSLVFPQPVVERFLKVRDSLVSEIRAAEKARIEQAQAEARKRQQNLERDRQRLQQLALLAQEESVVVQNHRYWAIVPFGVGQFQNRDPALGYTLLVSEALLGGLSLTSIIVQSRLATKAYEVRRSGGTVDEVKQQNNLDGWHTVKVASFWSFAAVAAGGILQAQLEFVPEFHETRKRSLPASLQSSLSAAPYFESHGGGLELMGRF
jgi:hypothetical protein